MQLARQLLCAFPRWLTITVVSAFWTCACGNSIPEPAAAKPHAADYRQVPYVPPAALPEVVPDPPNADAVWLDGHWRWRVQRWVWSRGGWVNPPTGARVARPQVQLRKDGSVWYSPQFWMRDGARIQPPPITKPAAEPPRPRTSETQVPR